MVYILYKLYGYMIYDFSLKYDCKIHDIYFVLGFQTHYIYPYIMNNVNHDTDQKQKQRKNTFIGVMRFCTLLLLMN